MCGIAGIVSIDGLPRDGALRAVRMRDIMAYRGPDEAGLHTDDCAAIAHRRLSIVDLSTGQQPLSNEDGTVWVTFNGEIYNHRYVRMALEADGHRYRTQSDTETIVHAYETWGDDCVHRFLGMFAFAVWDARKRRLLLTRDRLGVKPLYWARVGDLLLFASEIKSILASGLVEPKANDAVLSESLGTRSTAGEDTLFERIYKLLPGHQLVFERGEIRVRQYWDVPSREQEGLGAGGAGLISPQASALSPDVVERFRALLTESVRLRLMSDVPLGMFLSGGVDSVSIAAIMARLIDRPLQTFSVAFKERAFNELDYARQAARAIGAEQHEIVIDDRDFFGALPTLLWHEDEPIAHPSSVPLFFVSMLARRHVTVVLTGEGSDELMAGYGKYLRLRWNWRAGTVYERLAPQALRAFVGERLLPHLPGRTGRLVRRSFLAMARTPEAMFLDNFAAIRLADQRRLLAEAIRDAVSSDAAYAPSIAYFDRRSGTLLDRLLYTDIKTYLVELLMKQDQMSMAASIESRVPFLDHELVEFVAGLPDMWKLSGMTTKRILRRAMKGLVPDAILNRPKMGFPVPFASWTRRGWNAVARDVLLDRTSRERGLIDPAAVDQLLRDHADGRTDGGDRIWTLLNLELWHRTFIDQEGIQTLPHAPAVAEIGSTAAA